ncbi:hypothetical protein BACT_1079 [Bifidobacterium actinocoloniiforme DSM 22766]|uniref:Lipoprotein n=2 Tax=Bifidobacterium actinocoloniiforme TaxID=638619 RepID=A0A086Z1H7_9BIFI|nr:hypothetical protein AB656_04020 [Bifidobacterium actinocoloniiforme DSM 22766]KFI40377.1 hypothetical protein BACT_1079 [Bifidobacterium actinocoloniiforme DSM 22766]
MGKGRTAACVLLCGGLLGLGGCGTVHDVNTTSTGEGSCSTANVDISKAGLNEGKLAFTSSQAPNSSIKVDIATDKGKASVIGSIPTSDSGVKGVDARGESVSLDDATSSSKPLPSGGAVMTTKANISKLGLAGSLQSLTFTRLDANTGSPTGEGCTIHIK